MQLFSNMAEKVNYVTALILILSINEKISEEHRKLVPTILAKYEVPEENADRILDLMKKKPPLDNILAPIRDNNQKALLMQELIAYTYLSGKYRKEKFQLLEVCKLMGITTKLEDIKKMVLANLPPRI